MPSEDLPANYWNSCSLITASAGMLAADPEVDFQCLHSADEHSNTLSFHLMEMGIEPDSSELADPERVLAMESVESSDEEEDYDGGKDFRG